MPGRASADPGPDGSLEERLARIESLVRDTQHVATEAATWSHPQRRRGSDQLLQHLARIEWQRLVRAGESLPSFDDVQFRYFSQNGEDGIIWYLLSLLGDGEKRVVEICAGDGVECCAANLVVNHGWQAFLVDGDAELVDRGRRFYAHCGDTWYFPPLFVHSWVTPDNVNELLAEHGFNRNIDVLIIDMDGNDYWLWEAIRSDPRVVVVEINETLGSDVSVAISYDAAFRWNHGSAYRGASLRAFTKLARRRGYRLVGTERYNFNAFFVREDCASELLPERAVRDCLTHPSLPRPAGTAAALPEGGRWVEV